MNSSLLGRRYSLIIIVFLLFSIPIIAQDVIWVSVQGISDGFRNSKQQDRDEAIMDAKLKAIEKAGVNVKSITEVENFVLKRDWIESKAEAYLLPGFQIIDIGYGEDGLYHVVFTGSVAPKGKNLNKKEMNNIEARRKLAEMNIKYTKDEFRRCVENDDGYIVNLFLIAGMDPNLFHKYVYNSKKNYWCESTVLGIALYLENVEVAKTLMDRGANLDENIVLFFGKKSKSVSESFKEWFRYHADNRHLRSVYEDALERR